MPENIPREALRSAKEEQIHRRCLHSIDIGGESMANVGSI